MAEENMSLKKLKVNIFLYKKVDKVSQRAYSLKNGGKNGKYDKRCIQKAFNRVGFDGLFQIYTCYRCGY